VENFVDKIKNFAMPEEKPTSREVINSNAKNFIRNYYCREALRGKSFKKVYQYYSLRLIYFTQLCGDVSLQSNKTYC